MSGDFVGLRIFDQSLAPLPLLDKYLFQNPVRKEAHTYGAIEQQSGYAITAIFS